MVSKRIRRHRWGVRTQIHEAARPWLQYPSLQDSWWWMPLVTRWDISGPAAKKARRWERKIAHKLIVPGLFILRWDATNRTLYGNNRSLFEHHMCERLGMILHFDYQPDSNMIVVERVAGPLQSMTLADLDRELQEKGAFNEGA